MLEDMNMKYKAMSDLDSQRIKFAERNYRLTHLQCSIDPPVIAGLVHDFERNSPVEPFVIHLRDRSFLDTTIYTAIYRPLEEEVTSRMNGPKTGTIHLTV
jgi:hypothetical protein